MYDPFAPPPMPGTVSTTAVPPMPPVALPPVATPGGGTTGAPLQGAPAPNNAVASLAGPASINGHPMPNIAALQAAMQTWRTGLQDWHSQRPQYTAGMDPTTYRTSLDTWRNARPDHPDFRSLLWGAPATPVATPGGGTTGAPLPGTSGNTGVVPPWLQGGVGMVPGVPGSVGTNPNTQFPPNPGMTDWRTRVSLPDWRSSTRPTLPGI